MSLPKDSDSDKYLGEIRAREEEDVVRILAEERYGLPYANLGAVPIENEALRYITEADARAWGVAPFRIVGTHLHVAIKSPERIEVQGFKKDMEDKGLVCHFYMASTASLEKVWERYKEISFASTSRVGGLDIQGADLQEIGSQVQTLADVKRVIEEVIHGKSVHQTSHILDVILGSGIKLGISDVHIEPEEDSVRIRFRIDGVLQDITNISYDVHKLINSRLKLISGLKLTTTASAQDGRFSIFIENIEISVRVSSVPGTYGEGIVMRLLDPRSIQVNLEDMGINDDVFQIMLREIKKPNGMILLTGPTGSGKTTTLYSYLRKIYSPEIKIITIEDPIEYHLPGITQTQVEEEKGYGFLEGLRAALRQDPDVIMVGEIRDPETAKIAVESSLTGHLVFSTLHTNSAEGVIPRLIDLDVNPKTLVSALTLSVAQRLVRRLCQNCKELEKNPTKETIELLHGIIKNAAANKKDIKKFGLSVDMPIALYHPVGCEVCNMTGYKGRIGLFEAIQTTEAIEKIMPTNPSEREIKRIANEQGLLDMKEDGVVKIINGITSLEEVQSVVDLYKE
jgi:type IV pilus assembly protein PilB